MLCDISGNALDQGPGSVKPLSDLVIAEKRYSVSVERSPESAKKPVKRKPAARKYEPAMLKIAESDVYQLVEVHVFAAGIE